MIDEEGERQDPLKPGQIAPEMVRVGVRLSLLLILPAIALLILLPKGSSGFVITIFTLAIGLFLLAFVGLLVWWANRN